MFAAEAVSSDDDITEAVSSDDDITEAVSSDDDIKPVPDDDASYTRILSEFSHLVEAVSSDDDITEAVSSDDDIKPVPDDDASYTRILSEFSHLVEAVSSDDDIKPVHDDDASYERTSCAYGPVKELKGRTLYAYEPDKELKGTSENFSDVEGTSLIKALAVEAVFPGDDFKPFLEDDASYERTLYAYEKNLLCLVHKVQKETNPVELRDLVVKMSFENNRIRRYSSLVKDSYTSLEEDGNVEGISEAQNSTSEDGSDFENGDFSDVEDPDVKDDEYPVNVEDVKDFTNVGEVEHSSDSEYSSDRTTLLKPVLYIDKLSEEDPNVKRTIKHLSQFTLTPWLLNCIETVKITGDNYGEDYFIAGPALQIVAVHITNPTSKELDIYGHISVTDDKHNTYYIYNRVSESPEKVSPGHGFLPINNSSILPLISGNIEFRLKDCGDLIFERNVFVEYLSKYEDGHVRKLGIGGKDNCRATIFFTIIPYARVAEFSMYLSEPCPDFPDKKFQVHGRIKANDILCFKKLRRDPLTLYHGSYNYIGKCVIPVSVFSPLLLDVELHCDGISFADQVCEAVFCNYRSNDLKFACDDKKYNLGMILQWIPYSDYFDSIEWRTAISCQINKPTECQTLGSENEKSVYDLPASMPIKKLPFDPTVVYEDEKSDYDFLSSVPISLESAAVTSKDGPLVEVFSVLVGGGDSSVPLALCGKILVRDGCGTFYIFFRSPEGPDKLPSSNKQQQSRSLSLAWPRRCVVEEKLFMHINLEDSNGLPVCIGHLNWDQRPPWYTRPLDTRICAVIPGENGYFAAVHFSVFKNGLKAQVTVECSNSSKKDDPNNNDDRISVYGGVFIEYCNQNYLSRYENDYYRSIIFKRSKDNAVKVQNGTKIPLLKSMVSAPSDCEGIIVDIDMLVTSSESRSGRVFGRIQFKAKKNGLCEMRDGDGGEGWRCEGCHVKVMVDWFHP